MKTIKKTVSVLAALLLATFAVSCASTGQYMALSSDETVIGNVQSTFVVRSSLFFLQSAKDAVNTQAYIHLMEEAGQRYPGNIDLRDIQWVTGRSVDAENIEVSATGKVVRIE
jgi:hypothetical protein